MGKFIFWLVVIFAGLFVLRLVNVANARRHGAGRPQPPKNADTSMIRCVSCGVYLPRADAIDSSRGLVCGDAKCLPQNERGNS